MFAEVGYAGAVWGTIIERTGMTKGALYHHFDSKESLASAIIEEGSDTIANVLGLDKTARASEQLPLR